MVGGGVRGELFQVQDVAFWGHRVAQALLRCGGNHHRGLHRLVCEKLFVALRPGGHRLGGEALLFLLFQK